MLAFLNKIFSNPAIATAFSGFGNLISEKIFKKPYINNKSKANSKILEDLESIKRAIAFPNSHNQEGVFTHFFYKYKDKFSSDDVELIKNKLSADKPNYNILLNALLGLIESIN